MTISMIAMATALAYPAMLSAKLMRNMPLNMV